jgi:ketosteroid isomerase-like protein
MSQENVEILRRAGEMLGAGDLDRWVSGFFDREVEWHTSAEDPDAATYRGRDAFRRYVAT